MNSSAESAVGIVASLHLHPTQAGASFTGVSSIQAVAGKGIEGNPRYFERTSRSGGPSRRQVSLIEREQVMQHAVALGLPEIAPGVVRANIETSGINLIQLIGRQVRIGDALLLFYEARLPCSKMDAICQGLRELMLHDRQGVMAEVLQSGTIRVGSSVRLETVEKTARTC